MSAWLLALGLSAGYLMTKKVTMGQALDEQVKKQNESVEPERNGPSSEAIRNVQRTVPAADRYQDMNVQDLTKKEMDGLAAGQMQQRERVAEFEAGLQPMQGVYLNLCDRGF